MFFVYRVYKFSGGIWSIPVTLTCPNVVVATCPRATPSSSASERAMRSLTYSSPYQCSINYGLIVNQPRSDFIGCWTSLFALLDLCLVAAYPHGLQFCIFEFPLGSLYVNTVMANLNARDYIKGSDSGSINWTAGTMHRSGSQDIPMEIRVDTTQVIDCDQDLGEYASKDIAAYELLPFPLSAEQFNPLLIGETHSTSGDGQDAGCEAKTSETRGDKAKESTFEEITRKTLYSAALATRFSSFRESADRTSAAAHCVKDSLGMPSKGTHSRRYHMNYETLCEWWKHTGGTHCITLRSRVKICASPAGDQSNGDRGQRRRCRMPPWFSSSSNRRPEAHQVRTDGLHLVLWVLGNVYIRLHLVLWVLGKKVASYCLRSTLLGYGLFWGVWGAHVTEMLLASGVRFTEERRTRYGDHTSTASGPVETEGLRLSQIYVEEQEIPIWNSRHLAVRGTLG
ncbi:hypothetical protein OBBRIDRAFT_806231 [Obba rivulosa]|uniref:Uncharacterized protein n=1 Tax=Obba rivulosa TaxID=1052685 RepID=A0A8E2AS94_9APHY|nr:hypothetical protein OBBRIDRAFT_806231 [Obba rivulosa]